ncbi:MAG: hypothetical protein KDA24_03920 [Deltaproteobacteria bacterium]|nr:hypothetical protein [Deltaproteobacteria bacterium]
MIASLALVGSVLAAAAVAGAVPDDPRLPRWEVVPLQQGPTRTPEGNLARLVEVPRADALRLRCPDGETPSRRAVILDRSGQLLLVEGPFSTPEAVPESEAWMFAGRSDLANRWLVEPATCVVEALTTKVDALGLARIEHQAVSTETLRQEVVEHAVFTPEVQAWLDAAEDDAVWRERYLTVRTPGPHAVNWLRLEVPRAEVVEQDADGSPAERPWFVSNGEARWLFKGTSRVRIEARKIGAPDEPICLEVDGDPHCVLPQRLLQAGATGDGLTLRAGEFHGEPMSELATWTLHLGHGRHELRLVGPALVRGLAAYPEDHLAPRPPPPTAPVVFSSPAPDVLPAWSTSHGVAPEPTGVDATVFSRAVPALRGAGSETWSTSPRWVDLRTLVELPEDELASAGWIDAQGAVSVLLEPESPEALCRLRFPDGSAYAAAAGAGAGRFIWTGTPSSASPPLTEPGCAGLVRVDRALLGRGGKILLRFATPLPQEPVRWTLDPSVGSVLRVSFRPEEAGPVRVTLQTDQGDADYRITNLASAAHLRSTEGSTTNAGLRLPLGAGLERVTLRASHDVAVRITQSTAWEEEAQVPELPPLPTELSGSGRAEEPAPLTVAVSTPPDPQADLDQLRAASSTLAGAADTPSRVRALISRADLLDGLGLSREAWQDRSRAVLLDPEGLYIEDSGPFPQREDARLLVGDEAWMAASPTWVSSPAYARPEQVAGWASDAARGDHLAVASSLADAGQDSRLRLRWAVLGGQILTRPQRMDAYLGLITRTPPEQVDEPFFGPLRAMTRWEPLLPVSGRGRRVKAAWPEEPPPEGLDALVDGLFPDVWEVERTLRLRAGWELELPPSGDPRMFQGRCRPTRVVNAAERCRFAVLDGDGIALSVAVAEPWGAPVTLQVPASTGPLYVTGPGAGLAAQLLAPSALAPGGLRPRVVWELLPGATSEMALLGPSVLRLEVFCPGRETCIVDLSEGAPGERGERTRLSIASPGTVEVPVWSPGPRAIQIRVAQRTLALPAMRIARGSVEPWADRRIVSRLAEARSSPVEDPSEAKSTGMVVSAEEVPTGRPLPRPGTLVALLGIGVGEDRDEEASTPSVPRVVARQEVGFHIRPWAQPVWMRTRLRAVQVGGRGAALSGEGGIEARLGRGPWRVWLRGDGRIAGGFLATPAVSGHLTGRVTVERHITRRWQVLYRLTARARHLLVGSDSASSGWPQELWSHYQAQHRLSVRPEATLRALPAPWLRLDGTAWLTTNMAPDPQPIDHVAGRLRATVAWRAFTLRGDISVTTWLPDLHRTEAATAPAFGLLSRGTLWTGRDLAIQLGGEVRYDVRWTRLTAALFVRFLLGRDRGTADLRPSTLTFPHADEWGRVGAWRNRIDQRGPR